MPANAGIQVRFGQVWNRLDSDWNLS